MKEWNDKVAKMQDDELVVQTLRTLSVDMVQQANSGHPGAPMGCAAMAQVLWSKFLNICPTQPKWWNRDRFVLSNGHASALLYSLLHVFGFDLDLDELKQFRQWGSRTPGHPENHVTSGIETTTGPLGQGIANAVGFAIAEAHMAARYNRDNAELFNHYTYAFVGDGCLMEGISSEAASLAGHLGLSKLIVLYDDNGITIDGKTDVSFSENVPLRFESYGWKTLTVADGNDLVAIEEAIAEARAQKERPTLISVKNHIGFGSPNMQDTSKVHGSPLGDAEIAATKKVYGWPEDAKFFVPERVVELRNAYVSKSEWKYEAWVALWEKYRHDYPAEAKELAERMKGTVPASIEGIPAFEPSEKGMATRAAGGKVLSALHAVVPALVGGSADLAESNKTLVEESGRFCKENYAGRNIYFGIREHAMGAICNAMALYGGFLPYGATFLIFSDYMRNCIRLGALAEAKAFWVWTHDSIGVGEDGPTHQPVEHFASLRAIPKFYFMRPSDANETLEAYKFALKSERPVGLALSRQNTVVIDRKVYASADGVNKGGYVLISDPAPQYVIVATGSEVDIALKAYEMLKSEGIAGRVVSMPCMELFLEQENGYRESVLPSAIRHRAAVEAGVRFGWDAVIGRHGAFIGMEGFGASAPAGTLYEKFGITADKVVEEIKKMID